MTFTYLAGDIGGTNARICLFEVPEQGDEILLHKNTYPSQSFPSLTLVINQFLKDFNIDETPSSACFSVAGPVNNGIVNLTNLGWELSEKEMEHELKIRRVVFLNDFAACGYGVSLLKDDDLFELSNNKQPVEGGPRVIIGAGTGLGEANIFNNNGDTLVVPGEGGHTDFAPRNQTEFGLMNFIRKKLNLSRVGVERVVSGPGLENIYWYFASVDPKVENLNVSNEIRSSNTPGKIISTLAISEDDVICEKALRLFISCYGAEAGNMALNVLPSGGVYVAGGIAPEIRDVIQNEFMNSFLNKGRMRQILSTFPIYIVTNLSIGILGARYMARQKISEFNPKISRRFSRSDIHNMDEEATLISQNMDEISIPKSTSSQRIALTGNTHHRTHTHGNSHQTSKCQSSWNCINNAMVFAAGIGFSAIIVGAFFLGKQTKRSD